jgi:hypothetical protein
MAGAVDRMLNQSGAVPVWPRPNGFRRAIEIGGVSLGIHAPSPGLLQLAPDLTRFETSLETSDIEIQVDWPDRLDAVPGTKIFDSGSLWTASLAGGGLQFDFATPVLGHAPYKRLRVHHDFTKADLSLNRTCFAADQAAYPLEYPVDELLVTHWLARGRGVELHGCGLVDTDAGAYLFLGHSGAGKSTTTALWTRHRDVHVLSDDRIILRDKGQEIWMYGTPWHGEAGFASPRSARISHIFVLEHGGENEVVRLPTCEAAAQLFARCFVPFYDSAALEFTLSYVHRVADLVPCYSYKFRPDASAVTRILEFDG